MGVQSVRWWHRSVKDILSPVVAWRDELANQDPCERSDDEDSETVGRRCRWPRLVVVYSEFYESVPSL